MADEGNRLIKCNLSLLMRSPRSPPTTDKIYRQSMLWQGATEACVQTKEHLNWPPSVDARPRLLRLDMFTWCFIHHRPTLHIFPCAVLFAGVVVAHVLMWLQGIIYHELYTCLCSERLVINGIVSIAAACRNIAGQVLINCRLQIWDHWKWNQFRHCDSWYRRNAAADRKLYAPPARVNHSGKWIPGRHVQTL